MGKKIKCILIKIYLASSLQSIAKGIVAELASPHVRSAWGSRGERVRVAGLAVCCNYLSQKKKKKKRVFNQLIYLHNLRFKFYTNNEKDNELRISKNLKLL